MLLGASFSSQSHKISMSGKIRMPGGNGVGPIHIKIILLDFG
jgi:hypothetical protein